MIGGMDATPPIGLKIKRARERLRWSQAQLAAAIGVSQKTIDNWEHDKRYPKSAIGALEEVLGISFEDEPEPGPGAPEPEDPADQLERYAHEALEAAARLRAARQRQQDPNGEANGHDTRRAG